MGKISDRTMVIAVKVGGSDTKPCEDSQIELRSLRRAAGAQDVDVAIIKATNHNKVSPKEKHVMTLVSASRIGDQQLVHHICSNLSRRAHALKKWLIALKACITYHRLIREAGPPFMEAASASRTHNAHSLGLAMFRDSATSTAWDYVSFIRPYSAYIDQQVETYSYLQYFPELEAHGAVSQFRQMDAAVMLEQVPRLHKLCKLITLIRPQKAALTSALVQYAMILVLKESILLYKSCSEVQLNVVDKFFDLEPPQAARLLIVYKETIAANAMLVKYMLDCKDSGISQGIDLPADLQPVPEEFVLQMEEYASGQPTEPPIYESPMRVESPKKEPEPVVEEVEEPPPPPPPPVAAPREVPDLMCMDTPTASEKPPSPFKEEEDDELGKLWKEPAPQPANGFGSSQTGVIQTKTFLAGPTGMLPPPGPFQTVPTSNNPFLMPVAPPPAAPPPEPRGFTPGKGGVTNVLGDLGLDALGIRKAKEAEAARPPPMRTTVPTSLALPPPAPKPAPIQAAPAVTTPPPAPASTAPLIPTNPFYQAPPTGYVTGQQLALVQHDPFAPQYVDAHGGHTGAPPQPAMPQYAGGVTGYNQAVGYYLQPTGQPHVPPPPAPWQGGFTGAPHQSAAFGATPTGMPAPHAAPSAGQFRSSVTGPAHPGPTQANPFGGNAF